jgi:hypothetical protein
MQVRTLRMNDIITIEFDWSRSELIHSRNVSDPFLRLYIIYICILIYEGISISLETWGDVRHFGKYG